MAVALAEAPEILGALGEGGEAGGMQGLLKQQGGPGLGEIAKHAPTMAMVPLVIFAVIFIIIAIIVIAAKKYTAGALLGLLGLLLGGGAFFIMYKSESRK